jgi:hypothetical protein
MLQINLLSIVINLRRHRTSSKKKIVPPRHRFLEPIYNVKDGGKSPVSGSDRKGLSSILECQVTRAGETSPALEVGGASRDRTDDLKLAKLALSQLSYGPAQIAVVGREGVEPSTSRLSGVRSNHLSYRPPPLA